MKSLKIKVAIVVSALFVSLFCLCIGLSSNFSYDTTLSGDLSSYSVQTPVLDKAKSLPQSSDEVFYSVPSNETLDNLPEYINKSIELLDNESVQNRDTAVDNSTPSFFNIFKNGEIHKIYAVIKKDVEFYKLILTANKPEEGTYDDVYEITDTDEGVPAYCTKYVSKITSIDIDQSIENFHPVSTMQWFGSYIESSAKFPSSRLKSINGLRYLNMDKVTNSAYMFSGTKYLNSISDEDIEFIKGKTKYLESAENVSGMFIGSGLDSNALNVFMTKFADSSSLKYCQYSFALCSNLKNFENKNILLPKIENATAMFARSSIESFDNNIIFGNPVYSITSLFYECSNLKIADVSRMLENGTSYYIEKDGSTISDKISSTVSTFQSCENLTYVDMGKWDVSDKKDAAHINYTYDMFSGCKKLTTIDTRYDANWSHIVKESSYMFAGCTSLVGQNGTAYNSTNIHMGYARIDEGKTNPGYFTLSKNSPKPPSEEAIYSLSLDGFSQPGVTYLPVCDDSHRLPNDLVFYDINKNRINPSNGSYYLMSDLKEAKYFTGTSSFNCFRNYDNVKWDDVFTKKTNTESNYDSGEVKPEFKEKLFNDENVLVFEGLGEHPAKPQFNGIFVSEIYKAYKEKLSEHGKYWSNSTFLDELYEKNSSYFDSDKNEFHVTYINDPMSVFIQKTLNPNSMTPISSDFSCYLDYDDSLVEKVTNIKGDKTYPKNTLINYVSDFRFKVVMKDGDSVPRVYDGINELENKDNIFTVNNRYGIHSINIDKQTKFNINFEKDDHVNSITDKDDHEITNPGVAQLNEDFVFKVKCNIGQPYVIKEVKVDGNIIEPDYDNCYVIKNVVNHKNVVITSQDSQSLSIKDEGENYFYYPVFDILSADKIKFYDNGGRYIWPTANDGHDYVMSDLKNVFSYVGNGYKFQAIRFDKYTWNGAFGDPEEERATKFIGKLLEGDFCASLSFDKNQNKPLINNIYIGSILKTYNISTNEFWGPDKANDSEAYIYSVDNTKEFGSWTTLPKFSYNNIIIQREFSDYYDVKFEGDTGVKQIVDENGNDITNITTCSKDKDFKFKIKCIDEYGINTVEQTEISIDGQQHDPVSLQLDNGSLMYKINNIECINATGFIIKMSTTNVSSLKIDKCLYYPVFDTKDPDDVKFFDNDGQCLTPTKYIEGKDHNNYDMKDTTYATKYKILQDEKNNSFTAVRTINEDKWKNVFDRKDTEEGRIFDLQDSFKNKLYDNDNVCYFSYYDLFPSVDKVSLVSIYETYNNVGFGVKGYFHFWTNYFFKSGDHFSCRYYNSYGSDGYCYASDPFDIEDSVPNDCCMVVSRQFGKIAPSCTIEFHKDDGVDKITDMRDEDIDCNIPIDVTKSTNFQFHVYYKDGYVENQTKDGLILLNCDNNNIYTVNNIENKRVVEASSKEAKTLKCSDTSKHPELSYKPIFNKLSMNDVKFYDQNGHFMPPSQDDGTNYIMNDLKNNVAYFINNGSYSFKAVLIVQHTWDEAFGRDTQEKAPNYIADDKEVFEECENLNFDNDKTPFIDDVKLSDIQKSYFENDSFYWGNYAHEDKASRYSIISTEFWDDDVLRVSNGKIVLSRTNKDIYTINFNKDIGIEKFVDDKGQEIGDSIDVAYGSTLKFKPVYYSEFINDKITANGCDLSIEGEYYKLNDIYSDVSVQVKSKKTNVDKQTIHFQRSEANYGYIDVEGHGLSEEVEIFRSTDFSFKVKLKEGYAVDKLYLNDQVVECDENNVYTINSPYINNEVSFTFINIQSLYYDNELYHPIFDCGNTKVSADNIKFYDKDGYYLPSSGPANTYNMKDIVNATQYCSKDNYEFKAIRVNDESWNSAFGSEINERATKYINHDNMKFYDQCTTLSFEKDMGDLYIEDHNHNKVKVQDIIKAYYSNTEITSLWTSECLEDSARTYCLINDEWRFSFLPRDNSSTIVLDRTFNSKNSQIKFDCDQNVEKITDINDNVIDKTINFPFGADLKFKVVPKDDFLVDSVYINGTLISPNTEDNYIIMHVSQNSNISVNTTKSNSLIVKDGLNTGIYRPVFSQLPSDQVKFFDKDSHYIHPTGNNGYSYLMRDLSNATQFIGNNYAFDAVLIKQCSWLHAFRDLDKGTAIDCYLGLNENQSCATFNFKYGERPYISGVSLDEIVYCYYDEDTLFWTPESINYDLAYIYDINNGWKNTSEKNNDNSVLIKTTFASVDKVNVNFIGDAGVNSFVDKYDQKIPSVMDFYPGQELRFKVNLNEDFYLQESLLYNHKLTKLKDESYRIVVDSSSMHETLDIKAITSKILPLTNVDYSYYPIFNSASIDDVKFFDDQGNMCTPHGENNTYRMSDLKNAKKYTARKGYKFKAIRTKEESWYEAFGEGTTGRAINYIGKQYPSEYCSTLNIVHDETKVPSIIDAYGNSVSLIDIYKEYTFDYASFWTCDSCENPTKAYEVFANGEGSGIWTTNEKDSLNKIVLEREFSDDWCEVSFKYPKDELLVRDSQFNVVPDKITHAKDAVQSIFVVSATQTSFPYTVMYNDEEVFPDAKGKYTIDFSKSGIVSIKAVKKSDFIDLRKNNVYYRPIAGENYLRFNKIKFYNDDNNIIIPSGNKGEYYQMSDLVGATKFYSQDYNFTTVRCVDNTWTEAFGTLYDGIADSYLPPVFEGEHCANLDFRLADKPQVNGVSIDEISKIYFPDKQKYWGPHSIDNIFAYPYSFTDKKRLERSFKTDSLGILISYVFKSANYCNVDLVEKDSNLKLLSEDGSVLPSNFNIEKNHTLKFKIYSTKPRSVNQIIVDGQILFPDKEGFYTIENINKDIQINIKKKISNPLR